METRQIILKISTVTLLGGVLLALPLFAFAYSDKTTHPALTNEVVKFFNFHYPDLQITDEEKKLVIQGSIDEDEGTRPLRHFYDPVYERGLVLLQEWESSKKWAHDAHAQAGIMDSMLAGSLQSFFSGEGDYSWERAVYEHVWGDKNRGLLSLGHILHLIEDATVPDHTRNDAHPPFFDELINEASPYEAWVRQYDINSIDVGLSEKSPILLLSLDEYFSTVAGYSNNNFFSKDTVPDENNIYLQPVIKNTIFIKLSDGVKYLFGQVKINGKTKLLVRIDNLPDWENGGFIKSYKLTDKDNLILSDYWNLLSKQAVLNGAGVIKLFFDEVEKERETKVLYQKNRTWFQKIFDLTQKNIYNFAGVLYGTSVPYEELEEKSEPEESQTASVIESHQDTPTVSTEAGENSVEVTPINLEVESTQTFLESEEQETDITESIVPSEVIVPIENIETTTVTNPISINVPYPGFGGGGGSRSNILVSESVPNDTNDTEALQEETKDVIPPEPPTILSPIDFSTVFTMTTILFSGTAEASSTVEIFYDINTEPTIASTTVNSDWLWDTALTLNQGSTTIDFFAIDEEGNRSDATTTTLFIDSISPNVTLFNEECGKSLTTDSCLVATTTLHFSWSSSDVDLNFFTIYGNDVLIATTTATSTVVEVKDNETYVFGVSATDIYGNISAISTLEVGVSTMPVVVNEIAWMGTITSASDEWIELYNNGSSDINLEGWVLHAEDGVPYIPLVGSIKAGGYYLIERTDDDTISDIAADLVVPFSGTGRGSGLGNKGERLFLTRVYGGATTTIDEVSGCSNWCGGLARQRITMERVDSTVLGTDSSNWGTAIGGFILNGHDTDGVIIRGTPKSRNSITHLIAKNGFLNNDKTLTKENSPYLVTRSDVTIAPGATLTIEPGVVIKIVSPQEPFFVVEGTVTALGTADEPVVFTSYFDDEYGEDFNSDGLCEPDNASSTAACPAPGSWRQIYIRPSSVGSSFTHTLFRYGGRWFNNQSLKSAVVVDNTDVLFNNVTIEYGDRHGLILLNSSSVITDSTFQHNNDTYDSSGIVISGGAPSISGSTFLNNRYGLTVSQSSPIISSNIFKDNILYAVQTTGTMGSFEQNSGSGNSLNAIIMRGTITDVGTTTLSSNALPYLLKGDARVKASTTLAFEEGVVIKGHDSRGTGNTGRLIVEKGGTLFHDGTEVDDLIFTSMHDDSIGGIVGVATSTPKDGDWRGIVAEEGSFINMNGFTISYAETGFSLTDAVAELSTALFSNNTLDISAVGSTTVSCINCDTSITSPADLLE